MHKQIKYRDKLNESNKDEKISKLNDLIVMSILYSYITSCLYVYVKYSLTWSLNIRICPNNPNPE